MANVWVCCSCKWTKKAAFAYLTWGDIIEDESVQKTCKESEASEAALFNHESGMVTTASARHGMLESVIRYRFFANTSWPFSRDPNSLNLGTNWSINPSTGERVEGTLVIMNGELPKGFPHPSWFVKQKYVYEAVQTLTRAEGPI